MVFIVQRVAHFASHGQTETLAGGLIGIVMYFLLPVVSPFGVENYLEPIQFCMAKKMNIQLFLYGYNFSTWDVQIAREMDTSFLLGQV